MKSSSQIIRSGRPGKPVISIGAGPRPALEPAGKLVIWVRMARAAGFQVKSLAKNNGITTRQLERWCQTDLGRSPREWLAQQRMFAATWLLRDQTIKEVAFNLGYKQVSHFCRHFKESVGLTATDYQRRFAVSQG